MQETISDIELVVRRLATDKLGLRISPEQLEDQLYVGTASGFDSSKLLEFILSIEEKFNFFVPDEDLILENFESLSKIVAYISSHRVEA